MKKTDKIAEKQAGMDADNYNMLPAVVFIYLLKVADDERSLCCVELNDNMLELLQYTQLEVDAMGNDYFRIVMHPDDLPIVVRVIRYLKKHGRELDFGTEFRVIAKDGTISWIYMKCHVKSRHADRSPREFINCGIVMDAGTQNAEQTRIYRIQFNRELNKKLIEKLKMRDFEMMKLYGEGDNFSEIAVKMFVSVDTIHSRKKNVLLKLDLATTKDLLKFIIDNGFIYLLFASL